MTPTSPVITGAPPGTVPPFPATSGPDPSTDLAGGRHDGPPGASPRRTARRRETPRRSHLRHLRRWVSPVVLIALWQVSSATGVLDERTMAAPSTIFQGAVDLAQDGVLLSATLVSLQRVVLGFLIGAAIGLALAVLAGLNQVGEDAVDPPMQMLRTLPHFGMIPLLITWMGIGESPKIALIALIAMGVCFPLYLNTLSGIRGVDRKMVEAARSMNLTWAQRLRHVVIPGALPQVLVGLRQSLGIAWLSLIVAETSARRADSAT